MCAPVVLVLAMAAGVGAAGGAPATVPDEAVSLEEIARAYRSGAHERAVALATSWSDERVVREVRRLIEASSGDQAAEREVFLAPSLDVVGLEGRDDSRRKTEEREAGRLAAAAILLERALSRAAAGDPAPLAPGFSAAALLLDARPPGARGRAFGQRFHLLSGLVLQWHGELEAGYKWAVNALQRFPNDPELQTVVGSIIETVASFRGYDLSPASPDGVLRKAGGYASEAGGAGGVPEFTLEQAAAHYEQALACDPGLDETRLRLARVRTLMGLAEQALPDLERLASRAARERHRHLARLFSGHARQRQGDVAGAVASYRACIAHGPRAQTALVALGRSLEQLGDAAGAQEAFAEASGQGAPFDPWWSYGAGQPERFDELLAQLRAVIAERLSP